MHVYAIVSLQVNNSISIVYHVTFLFQNTTVKRLFTCVRIRVLLFDANFRPCIK